MFGARSEVFKQYMTENYFTRAGLSQSSFEVNVAACRVVLDILPRLEIGVLNDTDGKSIIATIKFRGKFEL